MIEKTLIFVYEVASDVRFGHELGNREFLDNKNATRERFGHSMTVSSVFCK
jgi:hypothetical protein